MSTLENKCKFCNGTEKVTVADGPDDFEEIRCPECWSGDEDMSGADGLNDR